MIPDNYFIADQFSLLSKLMDIHAENAFKSKSYAAAAFNIEKLPGQLSEIPADKLSSLKGIGDSAAKKITEILQTGKLKALDDLLGKTPPGILQMLQIKGLGPKKIATIWKDMEIETIGELLYACNENRLLLFKGFGEKTQANVKEAIEFFMKHQGSHLYAEIESYAQTIDGFFKKNLKQARFELSGQMRRQLPVIDRLDWITSATASDLKKLLEKNQYQCTDENTESICFTGPENIPLYFHLASNPATFTNKWFEGSCSPDFLKACHQHPNWKNAAKAESEEAIWDALELPPFPSCFREKPKVLQNKSLPGFVQPGDIKGIVHSHSTWSDGIASLEAMAKACIDRGLEYLVISDHSKSAFYANGLSEERIKEQHRQVDELNEKLQPFRIFKSIECDILNDGSLDYSNNVLSTFDLVIASIHSNLKMTEEKAMMRLLNAIRNPYTCILGHMTGRLLLSRPGYPVDHRKIIDTCAEEHVVIELNAHPRRLDIDWSWIDYAVEKGAMISINPDAHAIEGFDDCRYGVLAAQKAGLGKEKNLSSFSLKEITSWIEWRKKKKSAN